VRKEDEKEIVISVEKIIELKDESPMYDIDNEFNLDLIKDYDFTKLSNRFKRVFNSIFDGFESDNGVEDIRTLGMIGVIELKTVVNMEKIQEELIKRGVWLRPFGKLVYMMPPYISSENDLRKLCIATREIIERALY
jgi:adenosylmethionine-8-amino-7-oxononanoate aminotransferase